MNNRHSSRQTVENMIRSAVEKETPDMRGEVMASLRDHGGSGSRAPSGRGRKTWKYAAVFALAALAVTGALTVPQSVRTGPAQPGGKEASQEAQALKNPFIVEAYAAEKAGGEKVLNKTVGVSLMRPVSITGKDYSWAVDPTRSVYNDLNLLRRENGNQLYAKYVGFNLKCVGKSVKSVTYTVDRGGFAQIVNLRSEKYKDVNLISPWRAEQLKDNFVKYKDSILKKDPNYKVPEPNPNYGDGRSVEEGRGSGKTKEDMEFYGYLPVGSSYTLSYADQDDYTKQYACRLPITYTDEEVAAMDNTSMKELFHRASKAMDGTVVTVAANYEDGTKASKQCVLKLDPETWVFHAVEK